MRQHLQNHIKKGLSRLQQRYFSSTPAKSTGTTTLPPPIEPYEPGVFSRNPGLVLGTVILSIGGWVYRSHRSKKNFEAIQSEIADRAVISPFEASELRSSNQITYVCLGTMNHFIKHELIYLSLGLMCFFRC